MLTYTIFCIRKGGSNQDIHKATFTDLKLAKDTLSNLKFVDDNVVQTLNF